MAVKFLVPIPLYINHHQNPMDPENQKSKSPENKANEWKSRELGALWKREGKNQTFLSGNVKIGEFGVDKEYKIVVFTNKGKIKNERAPDFVIYEDRPRDALPEPAPESSPAPGAESTSNPEELPSGF